MKTQTARNAFYFVDDVMELLGVSKSKAYAVIRELNEELEDLGYMKPMGGRTSKKFFNEKFYCDFVPQEPIKPEGRPEQ